MILSVVWAVLQFMVLCIVVVCASTGGQPLVGCTEIYGTVNSGRLC